jgi:hypothetical protein
MACSNNFAPHSNVWIKVLTRIIPIEQEHISIVFLTHVQLDEVGIREGVLASLRSLIQATSCTRQFEGRQCGPVETMLAIAVNQYPCQAQQRWLQGWQMVAAVQMVVVGRVQGECKDKEHARHIDSRSSKCCVAYRTLLDHKLKPSSTAVSGCTYAY